jgi:glycosyltransferase involved in cell wall biosynthesis
MSRILIVGAAPLPFENQKKNYALNNRTWLVSKALKEEDHQVLLIASRVKGAYYDEESQPDILYREIDANFAYCSIRRQTFGISLLNRYARDFRPDCIVGVGTPLSSYAVKIKSEKPKWADLFGSLLAEAQVKARVYDDDFYSFYWRSLELITLKKADKFSTVSMPQRFCVIGELGILGRLNKHTVDYEFVHVMPIAVDEEPFQHTKWIIRNKKVADDDFVIFWSGGYNTWTDVDTLFEGLVKAMAQNGKIKFVSTGGAIERHDDLTFSKFKEKVQHSKFSDNFIFLGWIPTQDVGNCYLESDAGINIDRFSYEAVLGARNRINEMIKAGLPVITTKISEISQTIDEKEFGLTFQVGDSDGLAKAILALAGSSGLLNGLKNNLKSFPFNDFSYKKIMQPLKEWVQNPKPAPDSGRRISRSNIYFLPRTRYLMRDASSILKSKGVKELIGQVFLFFKGKIKGQFKRK